MQLRREPVFLLFGTGPAEYNWRGVWLFAVAYFGAFMVAGLLAPHIYAWVQHMGAADDASPFMTYLKGQRFSRYVDRVRMLSTVLLLVWLIGRCGLQGRFGFNWANRGVTVLAVFLGLGALSLVVLVGAQMRFLDAIEYRGLESGRLARVVLSAFSGALLLGWLEEAIFRGMLLRLFYTAVRPVPALLLSALVFAAVHFKSPLGAITSVAVDWQAGIIVAFHQSVGVLFMDDWLDFANYFLAGLVLNLLFLRTRSLIPCMGLHAGWVLVRNVWNKVADLQPDDATRIWGTERIVDGYASLILLGAMTLALYVDWNRNQRRREADLAGQP